MCANNEFYWVGLQDACTVPVAGQRIIDVGYAKRGYRSNTKAGSGDTRSDQRIPEFRCAAVSWKEPTAWTRRGGNVHGQGVEGISSRGSGGNKGRFCGWMFTITELIIANSNSRK